MANHILRKDGENATKNLTDDDIKVILKLLVKYQLRKKIAKANFTLFEM